ncbi:MAG: DNA-deoxyinosine glycosylase [Bacteroidota bacterium]|nr:DNA-deoxyinosine glycosylase [Bacteroidota bacterium]
MDNDEKHGLAPIIGTAPEILILGSLPSDESIRRQEYYGHPRNRFWPVMAAVLGEEPPTSYEAKKAMLMDHKIAVWDVFASARRHGSLDSAIHDEVPNDIASLLRANPSIRTICLNGGKAATAFHRFCRRNPGAIDLSMYKVHEFASTSQLSISVGWTFERLCKQWGVLRD